jgi:hypothetical protein
VALVLVAGSLPAEGFFGKIFGKKKAAETAPEALEPAVSPSDLSAGTPSSSGNGLRSSRSTPASPGAQGLSQPVVGGATQGMSSSSGMGASSPALSGGASSSSVLTPGVSGSSSVKFPSSGSSAAGASGYGAISAVSRLAGQTFAFVAESDGKHTVARQKAIRLGEIVGNNYVILDGIKPGEQIITSGVLMLTDGMPVTPQS